MTMGSSRSNYMWNLKEFWHWKETTTRLWSKIEGCPDRINSSTSIFYVKGWMNNCHWSLICMCIIFMNQNTDGSVCILLPISRKISCYSSLDIWTLILKKSGYPSSTVSWPVCVLSAMVGPNLTGLVCILDIIFIDRNTAGQTNRRINATFNKVLLLKFLSMDRPEENSTW